MKAHEVLRAAHTILDAGWCQGCHCRDIDGRELSLWVGERAMVHPLAAAFSIYGAICKAAVGQRQEEAALMWRTLSQLAERTAGVPGGTNALHPIIGFNEMPGQTQQAVLDLVTAAINELDPPAQLPAPDPALIEGPSA